MSLPLERWAKQAVLLERELDFAPVADTRVLNDLREFMRLQRMTWEYRERVLRESGEFLNMPEGVYAAILSYPNAQTITTTSIPAGKTSGWRRNASRTSLFARFRETAGPTLREATTPSRDGGSAPKPRARRRSRCRVVTRTGLSWM